MKKISILFFFLAILFQGNSVLAANCTGSLNSVNNGYFITDPDSIYAEGENINTNLSVALSGSGQTIAKRLSLVLVMDRSGSMDGSKIISAKNALANVVNLIKSKNNPNLKVSLVTFADSASVNVGLTNNYNSVLSAINSFSAYGQTSIGGGLYEAGREMSRNADSNSEKVIIFASDGEQTVHDISISYGLSQISSDVTVYTVGIGSDADRYTLEQEIALKRKGAYYPVSDADELSDVFTGILEEIISFKAKNLELTLRRDDLQNLQFVSSTPSPTSISNDLIIWKFNNPPISPDNVSIDIVFRVLSAPLAGGYLTINYPPINYSYDQEFLNGEIKNCSGAGYSVSVPSLRVFTYKKPILDFTSYPLAGSDASSLIKLVEDDPFTLYWRTAYADACEAKNNGDSGWAGNKEISEGVYKNQQIKVMYTGQKFNMYKMQCSKTYALDSGNFIAYSDEKNLKIEVIESYNCGGSIPDDNKACLDDDLRVTDPSLNWHRVGSCSDEDKCEYYECTCPDKASLCRGKIHPDTCGTERCDGIKECIWREL